MEANREDVLSISNDEVTLWVTDDRTIHLKALTSFGDPVELGSEEARILAEALLRFAARVE
jgi:hypothetical protein